jgi:response regulator RpfG family c-di-GMP phosphodiesterase
MGVRAPMDTYSILIVDDESDFRTLLVEALESVGHPCEGAETAEMALEMARKKHYAIIFTDLNMPGGLSGLDLLKAIQDIDPKTFCILMTGYATTDAAIQALKSGAYDFIQKPFKLAELDASLVRALNHYKALRENEAYQILLEERVEQRTREVVALKDDIEHLFEGFVQAAVLAIEARDPSTSGHSSRVADLTVGLAEAVNRTDGGSYGPVCFSADQIKELRYASLLHDFGKVGVREQVLVKARKLAPERLEQILQRIHQRDLESVLDSMRDAWKRGEPFEEAWVTIAMAAHRAESRRLVDLVQRCDEPKLLTQEVAEALDELEGLQFEDWKGEHSRIFAPADIAALRIPKGSLTQAERDEINSHVTHTFRFLSQIPWTGHLSQIPGIAYAHHERLNGMGYPRGLTSEQIPVQSKLMAICDVFDALVAADRPYKVAVTVPRSLQILEDEARAGLLDRDALAIFLESRIFELTMPAGNPQAERP